MNTINILIVEDDEETRNRYINELENFENMYLINSTGSSSQAINDIKAYSPDAIILDLELTNGEGDGLDVLKYLQTCEHRPYVMVSTNNSSLSTQEIARKYGADYIKYKQQTNYSEHQVLALLNDLMNLATDSSLNGQAVKNQSSTDTTKNLLDTICTELVLVGINTKHKGFNYLRDAIYIAITSSQEDIPTELSKKYKQNPTSVIRTMKYAIESTWNNQDIECLEKHYKGRISSDKGCPTITEFISYYAQCISNRPT